MVSTLHLVQGMELRNLSFSALAFGFIFMLSLVACGGPQEHAIAATVTAATTGERVASAATPTPTPEAKELICHKTATSENWDNVTCTGE